MAPQGEVPVFAEHVPVKQRVEAKVDSSKRLPGAISKSAEIATVSAQAGAEEIIEVLTSPQGKIFIHCMAKEVINGYLQCATSKEFRHAGTVAASDVLQATMDQWRETAGDLHRQIMAHSPVSTWLMRQYTGPYLVVLGTAVLAALVRFVLFGLGPIR